MRTIFVGAALIALAAPQMAQAKVAPKSKPGTAEPKAAGPSMPMPDIDIAKILAVFDKLFPPQPEPTPARLALSRTAVVSLFPDGTYSKMMGGMMHGMVDRVMDLTEADFGKPGDKDAAADKTTLRQKLAAKDPNFDQRMEVAEKVIQEELGKVAAIVEPRLREGLARSMARRFDEKQLSDIDAFLATPSGKAFGSQSMAMWVDPDVMRAMMGSLPEIMKAMPAAMDRLKTETDKIPKAKAETPPKS